MSAHTNLISLLTINRLIWKNLIHLQSDVMIPVLCFSVLCSRQGWTGNLAYRAFSQWADALSGRYMFFLNIYIYIYIYIYSSKCCWAAWTKKMPGPIFFVPVQPWFKDFYVEVYFLSPLFLFFTPCV